VLDALLLSPMIRSAVEVSQSPLFRRRFASVYDALTQGRIDPTLLRQCVVAAEPAEALTVAGYAVDAVDTTVALRPDAATVPDRSKVYSARHGKAMAGHQFSWLGRVIASGHSWFAPREVQRVPTTSTPGEVGAEQVQRLGADPTPNQSKVVAVDSHFPVPPFLRVFVGRAPDLVLLVRLASNRILYGPPPPPTGKPGRPRAHGAKVALRPPGPPARQETVRLLGQRGPTGCRVSAWPNQHFRAGPARVGLVVRAEFLQADGTPRDKRPRWLVWSGPQEIALADVVRISLLRFVIEHFFRFLKQRLGLRAAHVTDLAPIETWVHLVALAYGQLLLSRDLVKPTDRPWAPTARHDPNRPLTPGQVLAAWPTFSRTLDTPAAAPRRVGKAPGRAPGDRPRPRERYPVATARKWKVKTAA